MISEDRTLCFPYLHQTRVEDTRREAAKLEVWAEHLCRQSDHISLLLSTLTVLQLVTATCPGKDW